MRLVVRTIGQFRATAKITLANLVYNLQHAPVGLDASQQCGGMIAHSGDHERSIRSIMNTESGDHEHALAII